jgi:hypothetical protein
MTMIGGMTKDEVAEDLDKKRTVSRKVDTTGWVSDARNWIEALIKQEVELRGVCIENGFRSQKEIWAIENVLRQMLDLLEKKPNA